ncbi:MAG TPA: S53 family peptidase [Bryobacteraceae bacterium]|nr:S53 family peptidase [Bryobacteraceae bacterium]
MNRIWNRAVPPRRWGALGICACLMVMPASAQWRSTLTPHVPEAVSSGQAQLLGEVPGNQRLAIAISLPLRNEAALDGLLQQIYDPQSSSYRHYLSVEEFTDRFGPTQEDHDAVVRFAAASGLTVTGTARNRLVVDVAGTVANIERAFHVTMNSYRHPTENRNFYAPDREPQLDLNVPILHISGLDNFTLPTPKNIRSQAPDAGTKATGSGPNGQFVGSDMRAAYYGAGPLTGAGQSVGLFEFAGYDISDVQNYFQKLNQPFNVPVNGVSLNGVSLSCGPPSCDDSEQVLDIEMSVAMAPGLSQVVVYVGASDVSIFRQMAADNTSKQLSCSWGWSDNETSLDPIFKEMAVQGQSVFVASGDYGSSTPGDSTWPADDPYVTAVGGTDLTTTGPGGAWLSETGWSGSAGMPSKNGVPIPAYQQLPGVINSSNQGSTTLRNIPDIAAEANTNQYSCWDGFCSGGNGGTSYAAPQWAGFLALTNEQGATNGIAPVGFLNPIIYRIGLSKLYDSDFHDIVSGSNGKYMAVPGYDLVSGWGSFIGPSLINTLLGAK